MAFIHDGFMASELRLSSVGPHPPEPAAVVLVASSPSAYLMPGNKVRGADSPFVAAGCGIFRRSLILAHLSSLAGLYHPGVRRQQRPPG